MVVEGSPTYPVNQPAGDYLLVGYDLDERELNLGVPLHIALYWSTESARIPEGCRTIPGRSHCVQLVTRNNLIANAGFEWGPECETCAPRSIGYSYRMYSAPPSSTAIQYGDRNGVLTQYVVLTNSQTYDKSGLASYRVYVEEGWWYLQAGWVRVYEGSAWFGRRWFREDPGERDYNYVVGGARPNAWTHYAAVVQPPADAYGAEIWVLNYGATGEADFDGLLFVPLIRALDR